MTKVAITKEIAKATGIDNASALSVVKEYIPVFKPADTFKKEIFK